MCSNWNVSWFCKLWHVFFTFLNNNLHTFSLRYKIIFDFFQCCWKFKVFREKYFAGFGCPDDKKVCYKHCMGLNCKAGYCDESKNWLWCACSECNPHATVKNLYTSNNYHKLNIWNNNEYTWVIKMFINVLFYFALSRWHLQV